MIRAEDYMQIKRGEVVDVFLFAPPPPAIDYNMIVIWLLAVSTVVVGGFWSGRLKHKQYLRCKRKHSGSDGEDSSETSPAEEEGPESVDLSPKFVLVFVFMMCAMLLALYFLYDYIVYIIIGLFCFASCFALYSCSKPLLNYLPSFTRCRIPQNRLPLIKDRPRIRNILLALCCMGFVIWWGIERKKDYAWVLQNIMGVLFCIHLMKMLRLPNLKTCTILLVLLFVYDIFFVFITPLFTKSGHSVMVDVATGGSSESGEQLPMVLKVPRFADSVSNYCGIPYSLLGFGDILVPGLLISFCHGFDLKVQTRRIYYISTVIAYGIGLIITFIALAFMKTGQPALLYLVPCTLLTVVVIGWRRRELRHLWAGERKEEITEQRVEDGMVASQGYGSASQTENAAIVSSDAESPNNDKNNLITEP